jgi:hypothetical protein
MKIKFWINNIRKLLSLWNDLKVSLMGSTILSNQKLKNIFLEPSLKLRKLL